MSVYQNFLKIKGETADTKVKPEPAVKPGSSPIFNRFKTETANFNAPTPLKPAQIEGLGTETTKTTTPAVLGSKKPEIKFLPPTSLAGGGAYYHIPGEPETLYKEPHTTYGGVEPKKGFERADNVPVSLGGVNAQRENISYEDLLPKWQRKPGGLTATDKYLQEVILPQYKRGEITLGRARMMALQYLDTQQHKDELNPWSYKNVFSSVAENFITKPLKSLAKGVVDNTPDKLIKKYYNQAVDVFGSKTATKLADTINETQQKVANFLGEYLAKPLVVDFPKSMTAFADPNLWNKDNLSDPKKFLNSYSKSFEQAPTAGTPIETGFQSFADLVDPKLKQSVGYQFASEFSKNLADYLFAAGVFGYAGTKFATKTTTVKISPEQVQNAFKPSEMPTKIPTAIFKRQLEALPPQVKAQMMENGFELKVTEPASTARQIVAKTIGGQIPERGIKISIKGNPIDITQPVSPIYNKFKEGSNIEPQKNLANEPLKSLAQEAIEQNTPMPPKITVYKGTMNTDKTSLATGDFVTIDRSYAETYGTNVIEETVSPDQLYRPPENTAETMDEFIFKAPEELSPEQYSSASQKTANLFNQSGGQKIISENNGTKFELGDWGKNHQERKIAEDKFDRFNESELPKAIDEIQAVFKASNDPSNYRSDNLVWLSTDKNNQSKLIYTRKNANGAEEIIAWHELPDTKKAKYLENLASFGIPDRTRTGNLGLEGPQFVQLAYGDKFNIPPDANIVKSEKLPEGEGKVFQQFKASQKVKEEPALTEDQSKLEDISNLKAEVDILKDILQDHPARGLIRYMSKTGDFAGQLKEVTGDKSSKFAKIGDDIASEYGFIDSEEARASFEDYKDQLEILDDKMTELDGLEQSLVKPSEYSGSRMASVGNLNPEVIINKETGKPLTEVNVPLTNIQPPEMLKLYRDLMENSEVTPFIRKYPKALGMFYGDVINPKIGLNPSIFENEQQFASTFAHELGHFIDFLPDRITSRGNTIGRLQSLVGFYQQIAGDPAVLKIRSNIKQSIARYKQIEREKGLNTAQQIKLKELEVRLEGLNSELTINNPKIKEELQNLSQWWKPFDPESNKSFTQYRNSAPELYADFISVLFNAPDELASRAPESFGMFFDYLDKKPAVKDAYFQLMEDLTGASNKVIDSRIEDMYDGYKNAEMRHRQMVELTQKNKKNLWQSALTDYYDKNYEILKKEKELIRKKRLAGETVNESDYLHILLEESAFITNDIQSLMLEKVQPLRETYQRLGLTDADLGVVFENNRILADRAALANPGANTVTTALQNIQRLKERLGEDNYKLLEETAKKLNEVYKDILEEMYNAGGIDTETWQNIKSSTGIYAPFKPVEHILDSFVSAKIMHQIGTMKTIDNPLTQLILKMVAVKYGAIKLNNHRTVANFLKENFPEDIIDAEPNPKTGMIRPRPGYDTITWREDGKLKAIYVEPAIAQIVNKSNTHTMGTTTKLLSYSNRFWFKPAFVLASTKFQVSNLIRDFKATLKVTGGLNPVAFASLIKDYISALPTALSRAKGRTNELVLKMIKEKAIGPTFNRALLSQEEMTDWTEIERLLNQYDALPVESKHAHLQSAKKIVEAMMFFGDVIETLPKVVMYKRLENQLSESFTPKRRAEFIRNRVGTPPFYRSGAKFSTHNNIFLFSNIFKEGWRQFFDNAIKNQQYGPRTKAGYWAQTFYIDLLPKILMFAAAVGIFGEELKKKFQKISEYYKSSYIVIPISENEKGEQQFITLPQDESGRLISAVLWKSLNTGNPNKESSIMTDLGDIFNYLGGQVPGVSPLIQIGDAIKNTALNQNTYDAFRGTNVLTDDELKAGGWYKWEPTLRWVTNQLGITKIDVRDRVKDQSISQKTLDLIPQQLKPWDAIWRTSNTGDTELIREAANEVQIKEAQERIEKRSNVYGFANRYLAGDFKNLSNQQLLDKLHSEVYGGQTVKKVQLTNLDKQFVKAVLQGQNNRQALSLANAQTNEEKSVIIKKLFETMETKDFNDLGNLVVESKLVSQELWNETVKSLLENPKSKKPISLNKLFGVETAQAAEMPKRYWPKELKEKMSKYSLENIYWPENSKNIVEGSVNEPKNTSGKGKLDISINKDKLNQVRPMVKKIAKEMKVPEDLVFGQIAYESKLDSTAKSNKGAQGIAQIVKTTFDDYQKNPNSVRGKEIRKHFNIDNYSYKEVVDNPELSIKFMVAMNKDRASRTSKKNYEEGVIRYNFNEKFYLDAVKVFADLYNYINYSGK